MQLADGLKNCSPEVLDNAILVILTARHDTSVRSLAGGYADAEIGNIVLHTPVALWFIASTIIGKALNSPEPPYSKNYSSVAGFAEPLKQSFTDRRRLDVLLITSLYPEEQNYVVQ